MLITLFAQVKDTIPVPEVNWVFQYGSTGALLFCMVVGIIVVKWLLDRHDKQIQDRDAAMSVALKEVANTYEKVVIQVTNEFKSVANDMKSGFEKINAIIDKEDDNRRDLFEKQLETTIKVTESVALLSSRVADNTKELSTLKSFIMDNCSKLRIPLGCHPQQPSER